MDLHVLTRTAEIIAAFPPGPGPQTPSAGPKRYKAQEVALTTRGAFKVRIFKGSGANLAA